MTKVALDTNIIIEYIDKKGSLHEQAEAVFSALLTGKLEAVIPHPVLAETYYVATKLYDHLGVENPHAVASKLIRWLYQLPTATIPADGMPLAIEAGRAKLNHGVALTDSYVLAASALYDCKALFKRREGEMLDTDLLAAEYEVLFLEDYE